MMGCLKGRGQHSEQGGESWKQVTKDFFRHQTYHTVKSPKYLRRNLKENVMLRKVSWEVAA